MAIDPRYIPAFTIETVILDKDTGAPLSGGIVTFEQDNQPGTLKNVYQITGTSPDYTYTELPNPMTLSSIGTFEDSLSNPVVPYFLPYDDADNVELYRVIVESSAGTEQFTREAVPYVDQTNDPEDSAINFSNELTNPQFANVVFDTVSSSYAYTFTGAVLETVALGAGWDLVVSGTGTVTVSQTKPVGTINILTNPGTLLNITSAGVSSVRLRQRLYGSPNLFGNGRVTTTITGKTFSSSNVTMQVLYSQSNGAISDLAILTDIFPQSQNYVTISESAPIPLSNSVDNYPDAYVDIDIVIPLNINIEITSVQVVSTGQLVVSPIEYDQSSNDRQIDYEFNYFKPQLDFKPIPSMLTGWDFPLNPAQPRGTAMNITTTPQYTWDQTIATSVVGNMALVRNAVTGGYQATTANNTEAFYVMQYLSGSQARKMLNTQLSVNIDAFRTQTGGTVTARVYLYRATAAAVFPTMPTTIGTIAASGVFTLTAANWTLIPRGNQGQAQGALSTVDTTDYTTLNDVEDLQFNGWEITTAADIADTDKFAIVVTFQCPTTGTVVTVNSISLVPGSIATRPAPQTQDEVLRECQHYFEMSFNQDAVPGTTVTTAGVVTMHQTTHTVSAVQTDLYGSEFTIPFNSTKLSPTGTSITFYSPVNAGLSNAVEVGFYEGSSGFVSGLEIIAGTNYAVSNVGKNRVTVSGITDVPLRTIATLGAEPWLSGVVRFHYTASSRPGIQVL